MYDLPLITIREVTADEYEEVGGVDFNDPDFRPMLAVTIHRGIKPVTEFMLLDGFVRISDDYVMAP